MRTISVPTGIGDSIWLFQKLINAGGEKFNFNIPDSKPQRALPMYDLMPDLISSAQYVAGLSYRRLSEENIQNYQKEWRQITAQNIMLSCNVHLESGFNLKDFLPDLPISYKLPWRTEKYAPEVGNDFPESKKYIGIYGSAYNTARAWGFWEAKEWALLIERIHQVNPDLVFVIIGAAFDLDLAGDLSARLTARKIPFVSTVGKEIGYVAELMKVLSFAFYFPSGLPIFSESLGGCDSIMFYPQAIKGIMGNWADPERIKSGNFTERLFPTDLIKGTDEVFEWFRDEYKFEDKIA